jgi:hypothetical protein
MRINWHNALVTVSTLAVAAGVGLRVVPISVEVVPIVSAAVVESAPVPSAREQAEALLSYQQIVEANIFSRNRIPPSTRYVPPELAVEGTTTETGSRPAPSLRLFGVAVGPMGAVALIDADPTIPGAEVYRLGDAVGDALLAAIEDTAVVLEGPNGQIRLRLPSLSRRLP